MSAARIGRVTMKNGGAELRIIEPARRSEFAGVLVRHASNIAQFETADPSDPIVATYVFALFKSGATSTGARYVDGAPLPHAALPHIVSECVRRDFITKPQAEDTFHSIFEWQGK